MKGGAGGKDRVRREGKAGSPRDEGCFDEGEDEYDGSGRNGHGGSSSLTVLFRKTKRLLIFVVQPWFLP